MKICSKCNNKQLRINFYKEITKKDGLRNQCIKCTNQYHSNNNEKRNLRERKRRAIYVFYRLINNTRRRIPRALKGKSKSSSTIDYLGIDIITYKRWIEFQLSPEMNWFNIEIDHMFNVCLMYLMAKS